MINQFEQHRLIMKNLIFLVFFSLIFFNCKTQSEWCMSNCNAAGDEKGNTEMVHDMEGKVEADNVLIFPLRIVVVTDISNPIYLSRGTIQNTINILNEGFEPAMVKFEIARVDTIFSELKLEDLRDNGYKKYREFTRLYDLPEIISLFFFDYDLDLCKKEGFSITCARTSGFSYVLSEAANNVVLSKFDLGDHKVVVHEFGHFFGLYHTFEEFQFGKENPDGSNSATAGDRIADTPADPGNIYEVHVNYSQCEMVGYIDPETGVAYKPDVNNYMAYYRPCYLTEYEFTRGQIEFLKTAARSDIRKRFAK